MRREERSIGDRGIGSLMHIMVTIGEKSNRMRVNDSGFVKEDRKEVERIL